MVAGLHTQRAGRAGAQHTFAEHGQRTAALHAQVAELEVVERRAHDGMAPGPEPHVHRNGPGEIRFLDPAHLAEVYRIGDRRAEI